MALYDGLRMWKQMTGGGLSGQGSQPQPGQMPPVGGLSVPSMAGIDRADAVSNARANRAAAPGAC